MIMQYKVTVYTEERTIVSTDISHEMAIELIAALFLEKNKETIARIPLEDAPADDEVAPTPRKKYRTRKVIKAEQFSVKPGKVKPGKVKPAKGKRGGKKTITDVQIHEVLNLKKASHTIGEIVKETGLSSSTVYRITSGLLKPEGGETPTKVGERAIDQKPAMLTGDQWSEAKDAYNDGLTAGAVAMSLELDTEEVRRAVKCDNYTEYTAKY